MYIENRELLSPRRPNLNPAVEWDRLLKRVGELVRKKIGSGQVALHNLTDQHLRRMMADGVIPASLGNPGLKPKSFPFWPPRPFCSPPLSN